MERTDKPSLNIYDIESSTVTIYPEIKKNDYFLLTPVIKPIIKPITNNINNSVINLKRKRSLSF
jgi:hypothetical protein